MTTSAASAHPIRRLDPATVDRIAAGEVIERPASVVKELVENALDAGARTVTVRISGGGLASVEVADDGRGIPPPELPLALERHATSKLPPGGPIDRIATLGFRGEALASIAAVARLRLASRPAGTEVAEGVSVEGGGPASPFAEPRGYGTTVSVADLFFNTPARRKFLRGPAAEQVEIVRTVERLYLARPDVSFRVLSEGRELAVLPATGELLDAARTVLGPEIGSAAFALRAELPGGTAVGLLGHPALARPTSGSLYLAVNGRPIVSRPLAQAIRLGFGDTIPRTRFPVGVVQLELALDRLDVNVHPTKREVRFLREREVADALRRSVREALTVAPGLAPPRGTAGAPWPGAASFPSATVLPPPPPDAATSDGLAVGLARHLAQTRLDIPSVEGPEMRLTAARLRPRLDLLGTVEGLYWVAASDDGLVMIDQHAASERYLFDTLRARGTVGRQALVEPIVLELPPSERAALEAHAEEVRAAGFEVEAFGPAVQRLVSVPVFRGRRARPEALRDLLRELAQGGRPTVPDALADRVTATVACHAAIRAGDVVDPTAFSELLRALDRLPEPARTCPHGRPIMVHLPRSRLDRWFLRQGA